MYARWKEYRRKKKQAKLYNELLYARTQMQELSRWGTEGTVPIYWVEKVSKLKAQIAVLQFDYDALTKPGQGIG